MALLRAFVTVAAASFAVACSVTPVGQDLTQSQGTEPSPQPQPEPEPPCVSQACPKGETTFANLNACTNAGATKCSALVTGCGNTLYCGSFQVQCGAVPTCDAGDIQASTCSTGQTCYQRTACGSTITCVVAPPTGCKALPVCDAGDVQVSQVDQCKDADCYSRTTCGTTIWCVNVK